MVPFLHNVIRHGLPTCADATYHKLVFQMARKMWESDRGEDEKWHAGKVMELMILYSPAHIDEVYPLIFIFLFLIFFLRAAIFRLFFLPSLAVRPSVCGIGRDTAHDGCRRRAAAQADVHEHCDCGALLQCGSGCWNAAYCQRQRRAPLTAFSRC